MTTRCQFHSTFKISINWVSFDFPGWPVAPMIRSQAWFGKLNRVTVSLLLLRAGTSALSIYQRSAGFTLAGFKTTSQMQHAQPVCNVHATRPATRFNGYTAAATRPATSKTIPPRQKTQHRVAQDRLAIPTYLQRWIRSDATSGLRTLAHGLR